MAHFSSVIIVENHQMMHRGLIAKLKQLIGDHAHIDAVSSAEQCLAYCEKSSYDLAIIDLRLPPGMNGIELSQSLPECTYKIIHTGVENLSDVQTAIRAGCHGYVTKSSGEVALKDALHHIAQGKYYIPKQFRSSFTGTSAHEPNLTTRMRQVLVGVQDGLTNREIAQNLCISEHTVKIHLSNLLQLYKRRNRSELIDV